MYLPTIERFDGASPLFGFSTDLLIMQMLEFNWLPSMIQYLFKLSLKITFSDSVDFSYLSNVSINCFVHGFLAFVIVSCKEQQRTQCLSIFGFLSDGSKHLLNRCLSDSFKPLSLPAFCSVCSSS